MADPAGLSAAVLVGELCALGYSYPNIKYYTKKEVFAAFRVVYRGRNETKNGILGVIWRRRVERGPNLREERAGRALYGGASGVRALPAVGIFLLRRGATHPPGENWCDAPPAAWGPTLPLGQPNLDSTSVSPS